MCKPWLQATVAPPPDDQLKLPNGAPVASIDHVTLEVPDPAAAGAFYTRAFGLGEPLRLRASETPTTGFRGFTLSLVVSQPATVDALVGAALDAGATALRPVAKSFWGYGGVCPGAGRGDLEARHVEEEGHRAGDLGPFHDPDGFAWEDAQTGGETAGVGALAALHG